MNEEAFEVQEISFYNKDNLDEPVFVCKNKEVGIIEITTHGVVYDIQEDKTC